jgi:hypothetical protein
MKKEEAAKLIANKTHAIYNDDNNFELLREILLLAFPNDEYTKSCIFSENRGRIYGTNKYNDNYWANNANYLKDLEIIKLSDINESSEPTYYDNSKGSIYQFCENQNLNAWEFEIIKRVVRCRKKGEFISDLEKTIKVIEIYLNEQKHLYINQYEKLNGK